MNITKIIRHALEDCGWTQKTLAEKCGYRSQSAVANKLSNGNLRLGTLLPLLDAMGFDLVIQSRNPKKLKSRWIVTLDTGEMSNEYLFLLPRFDRRAGSRPSDWCSEGICRDTGRKRLLR